jgi:hypothetical protein
MFRHAETFALFALAVLQGVIISKFLENSTEISWGLSLLVGCIIGFIVAAIELSLLFWVLGRKK